MEGDDDDGEGGEGWDVDDDLVLPPDLVSNVLCVYSMYITNNRVCGAQGKNS